MLQNIFSLFYQLIECWSSFAISWCRWNWSHDKGYTLGLADLLCHITTNPYPNCKPVSVFQILLKECCRLHQKFSHKRSRLYQPSRNNNAESPNDDHSHNRNSLWNRFIILTASDVPESFLSSQSHKPLESDSSKNFSSRVRDMAWSSWVRVESQKCRVISSHWFANSSQCRVTWNFSFFSITFFMLRNGAR